MAFLIAGLLPPVFVSAENVEKEKNAVPAENTTTVNLQALIEQLQNQIKELQDQLAKLKTEVEEVKEELKLTKNLRKGLSDEEVKELQKFLSQFREIYPEGLITGYFGSLTEKAVKKFQEKYGIEPVGVVGPLTRNKINESLAEEAKEEKVTICHIPLGNPDLKHTLTIGKSALEAHLAHGDAVGVCPQEPVPTPNLTPTPPTTGPATPSTPSVPQQQFSLRISANPASTQNLVPGDINAKVVKFELLAGSSNNVVVNKLVIGKKSGSAGCYFSNFKLYDYSRALPVQVGTTVSPDSECRAVFDNLNLAIPKDLNRVSLMLWVDVLSSASIGDTFYLGITEAECAVNTCPLGIVGLPAYAPPITIVRVAIPTITLLSPVVGEIWLTGQPYTLKWKTTNLPSNAKISIAFFMQAVSGTALDYYPSELAGLSDDGNETWTTRANFIPGDYRVFIFANYEISGYSHRISDGSDLISIGTGKAVTGKTIAELNKAIAEMGKAIAEISKTIVEIPVINVVYPSVNVLSPNYSSEEKWYIGNSYTIKWEQAPSPPPPTLPLLAYAPTAPVKIFLFNNSTGAEEVIAETTNTGSYVWSVPAVLGKMKLGEGHIYKIRVEFTAAGFDKRIYGDSRVGLLGIF